MSSSWSIEWEKKGLCAYPVKPLKSPKPGTFGLVIPVFPETCFSSASIRLLILVIITDVFTGVNETEYFSLFKGLISQLRRSWYAGTSVLA